MEHENIIRAKNMGRFIEFIITKAYPQILQSVSINMCNLTAIFNCVDLVLMVQRSNSQTQAEKTFILYNTINSTKIH